MIDIVSLCSKNNPYLGSHLAQPLALSIDFPRRVSRIIEFVDRTDLKRGRTSSNREVRPRLDCYAASAGAALALSMALR